MKKEKIIKTHTRKTKSGKTVTVKQHTAKYDAAEEAKKLAKKIGAGKEFQSKKANVFDKDLWDELLQSNEASEYHKVWDELEKGLNEERETGKPFSTGKYKNLENKMKPIKVLLDKKYGKGAANYLENNIYDYVTYNKDGSSSLKTPWSKEKSTKSILNKKTPSKDAAVVEKIPKEKQELFNKAHAQSKGSPVRNAKDTSTPTIQASDFKAWYHWDAAGDPKNKTALAVEKKLRAKMGRSEYNKYFDEVTNSYSSRGHLKAYKALEPETAKAIKGNKMVAGTAEAQKEVAKLQGAKKAEKIFAAKEKEAKGNLNKLSGKGTESKYGRSTDSLTKRKAAEKHKLSYNENGYYVDKDGQTYGISGNGHVIKRKYKYTTQNSYFHPDKVSKQVKFKAKEGNNYKMPDGSILTYIGRNVAKGRKGEYRFKDFKTGKIKFKDSDTIYALSEQ